MTEVGCLYTSLEPVVATASAQPSMPTLFTEFASDGPILEPNTPYQPPFTAIPAAILPSLLPATAPSTASSIITYHHHSQLPCSQQMPQQTQHQAKQQMHQQTQRPAQSPLVHGIWCDDTLPGPLSNAVVFDFGSSWARDFEVITPRGLPQVRTEAVGYHAFGANGTAHWVTGGRPPRCLSTPAQWVTGGCYCTVDVDVPARWVTGGRCFTAGVVDVLAYDFDSEHLLPTSCTPSTYSSCPHSSHFSRVPKPTHVHSYTPVELRSSTPPPPPPTESGSEPGTSLSGDSQVTPWQHCL